MIFHIFDKPKYKYEDIYCIESLKSLEQGANGYYDMYRFTIYMDSYAIGSIDYRDSDDPWCFFGGNIGYHIAPIYRGNYSAYKACMALVPFILSLHKESIYISTSPENIASKKTIERLNTTYIDTVNVPSSHWSYRQGEPVKLIYRWDLSKDKQ